MEQIYDVIIIGGGPAGFGAALYAARAGFNTLVFEKMSVGGQMMLTDIIDNYPGFNEGIDGFTLSENMKNGAERFGAKTVYKDVLSVDFSKEIKEINTKKETFYAKAVVVASGANPKKLGLLSEEKFLNRGVHYCAHCDGRFYKDKTVAVIGGGNSAVSDALYLSKLCKKVYLIHRRDSLRATKVYHEPLKNAENVEFLWHSTVEEFVGENRLSAIKIKNLISNEIKEISLDGVFVSIGRSPNTEFLGESIELQNGFIVADETTKTNIPGVFAAGDVRTKALRQVITAAADGATSAHYLEEYLNEK